MKKPFKRVIPENVNVTGLKTKELKPLNIKCGSTQCGTNLHCFSRYVKSAEKRYGKKGVCYSCGHESIDRNRIHKRDILDSDYIFESLDKELVRHVFATIIVDKEAIEIAKAKTKLQLNVEAKKTLENRIGKYNNYIDSRQTPYGGSDIVNYAQHATATCCRACLQAWYN